MPEFIQHAKGCLCNHVSISDNNIHSIINNNTNVDGFYNRQTIHGKHAWHGKSFVRWLWKPLVTLNDRVYTLCIHQPYIQCALSYILLLNSLCRSQSCFWHEMKHSVGVYSCFLCCAIYHLRNLLLLLSSHKVWAISLAGPLVVIYLSSGYMTNTC